MPVTVNVNNLSLCHKGSDGYTIATAPDVCKTPPVPLPIPYPNIAFSSDLAGGTTTVFADGGNSIAHKPSIFATSIGDEPGTLGGVKSGTFMKEASWITFSADVKIEGQNACRLTDKMFHNHKNTVNAAGEQQPIVTGGKLDCKAMWAEVQKEVDRIANMKDPIARNKEITAAYAKMYQANPELKWSGMGAFVSKEAGCGMAEAKKIWDQQQGIADALDPTKRPWWAPAQEGEGLAWSMAAMQADLAKTVYNGLADGNKAIFKDIFPKFLFYSKYGNDVFQKCADAGGVSDKLKEAFNLFAKGGKDNIEKATMLVAQDEQSVTLENVMQNNPKFKDALGLNKIGNDWYVGRLFGAKSPDVFMSSGCGFGPRVPFEGDIRNVADRLKMAEKVSQAFDKVQDGWPGWFNNQMSLMALKGGPIIGPPVTSPPAGLTVP